MKKLLILLLILFAVGCIAHVKIAYANTPCAVKSFYDGYSGSFYNTSLVKGFVYGLDEKFMWILFISGSVAGFPNVPQSVAQAINYTKTPDQFYATRLKAAYKQVLQAEDCQPLLAQTGAYLLAQ